jgi:uncharacterized membrane protein YkvA (DUF1232 family)
MSRSARSGGRSGLFRTLNYLAFVPLASRAPSYARLVTTLLRDARIPRARKALLAVAAAYVVSPIDVLPDAVPLIGAIDDVIVLVLALELFFDGLPHQVLDEVLADLDIDTDAFERDRAQVRRLVPRLVRQLAVRVPRTARVLGSLVRRAGPERRPRSMHSVEVFPA